MKNLVIASALAFSTFAIAHSASANTYPSVLNTTVTVENATKPKVKIRLSWKDGFSVEIEITFRTAPGGNDNATGELIAKKGINEAGLKRTIDVLSWSWGTSNPSILNGATDIVVTKGATLPDGTVIHIGDRLEVTSSGFTIKSPRDAASGMATGKR